MAMLMACFYAPMASAVMTSKAGDTIRINEGKYYLNNSQWGAAKQNIGWQQIFYNYDDDFGWRWSWPSTTSSFKADPSLISGWHWSSQHSSNDMFPIALASLHHLRSRLRFELKAQGRFSVMYDLWCHTTANTHWYSLPTAEVVIWLNHTGTHPTGEYLSSVQADGYRWLLYVSKLPAGWPIFTFVLEENVNALSVDIAPLLTYLTVHQLWEPESIFISGIEFGSEIYSGAGELRLRDWQLAVD